MNLAVIYHWWAAKPMRVWEDRDNPILFSIATLRAYCLAPIYVIDCSDQPNEWGSFPRTLDFKIIPAPAVVPGVPVRADHLYRLCSRAFTIPKLAERLVKRSKVDTILYCDSDVFWLKPPEPLACSPDKMCAVWAGGGGTYNNGVFYYCPNELRPHAFITIWQDTIRKMLLDDQLGHEVREMYHGHILNDEAAFNWVAEKMPNLINAIPITENYMGMLYRGMDMHPDAKNYHLAFRLAGTQRGRYAIWLREFYEAMERTLTQEQLGLLRQRDRPCIGSLHGLMNDLFALHRQLIKLP